MSGKTKVMDNAAVTDFAMVMSKTVIQDKARIFDEAQVSGNVVFSGTARIIGVTWDVAEGHVTEGTWLAPGIPV